MLPCIKADDTASRPRAEGGLSHTKNIESNTVQPREGGFIPPPGHRGGAISLLERGPLAVQVEKWRACAVNTWVMLSVSRGYRLQFATKPPRFNGVLMSVAEGEAALVLQNKFDSLLLKRAIRVVPIEESQQGFYSRYFLIPKKGGALRPILDLRVLNSHLRKIHVQNVNNKSVVSVYPPRRPGLPQSI